MNDSKFGQVTECSKDILYNLFYLSMLYFSIAFEKIIELLSFQIL
jgi:hypothetical protein